MTRCVGKAEPGIDDAVVRRKESVGRVQTRNSVLRDGGGERLR